MPSQTVAGLQESVETIPVLDLFVHLFNVEELSTYYKPVTAKL